MPHSTHQDQAYAEGQEGGGSSIDLSAEHSGRPAAANGGEDLWRAEDEQFYGENGSAPKAESGSRWRYPANFEDTLAETEAPKKKKKDKKDRWERTDDAYSIAESDPAPRKRKKSKRSKPSGDSDTRSKQSESINDFPEDAEGGLYGDRNAGRGAAGQGAGQGSQPAHDDNIFSHEF